MFRRVIKSSSLSRKNLGAGLGSNNIDRGVVASSILDNNNFASSNLIIKSNYSTIQANSKKFDKKYNNIDVSSPYSSRSASTFKADYDGALAERAQQGIVMKPMDAEQTSKLVELLKSPPKGEEAFLVDLLVNRVPPGVDEAAYVKAAFLTAVAKGEAKSPLITPEYATRLLGTMQGGYNIASLVDLLDHSTLAPKAADELCNTLLMFEAFRCRDKGQGGQCPRYARTQVLG